jgi:hypothetical protein
MNANHIVTEGFSNPESEKLYRSAWPGEPQLKRQCEDGGQCGGCAWFAPFNADWGLCCHPVSRHRLETVFEHFTCGSYAAEGWGPHSFSDFRRCRCGGEIVDPEMRKRVVVLKAPDDAMPRSQ